MAGLGRNERCPCGSGRKVKRCCGVRRGPSEDELAKAFLAVEARAAAWVLRDHDDEQLDELHDALVDLPAVDQSLLWPLPRLLTPEFARLGDALAAEDTETVRAVLPGVLARLDTPRARGGLARAAGRRAGRGGGHRPCQPLDHAGAGQPAARGRRGRWGRADRQRAGGCKPLTVVSAAAG